MGGFSSAQELRAIEAEQPWEYRDVARSMHDFVGRAAAAHGARPAVSFQLLSDPGSKSETLSWSALFAQVTQAANLFRSLGVGERDVVAFVLPNCMETVVTLLGGAVAGIVNPVNPLLEPEQISAILRETGAKVVVTLKPFPKTDLSARVAEAVKHAPAVKHVLEVDLVRYLAPPKSWIAPFLRPKTAVGHTATVQDFRTAMRRQPDDALTFTDTREDRVAAYFHTGGTTGMPKVAQHRVSGMIYNGWIGARLMFRPDDVVMCPLPLFHVFAAYPVLMSMIASGAHVVFPTPAGYRGDGVFDNFWRLTAQYKASYMITVPTALAALMQRPINADVSSLRGAFSGSAPLPVDLFKRFEAATGVQIIEGYGLTECTCLVSINPPDGIKKTGSVGFVFPYTNVRILKCAPDGTVLSESGADEVGEICVASPGVYAGNCYTDASKNVGLFAEIHWLRTGDLGRIDAEGYLFITGRAKDLIIRGGHNIDPAIIEEALMVHPEISFVGAIGQPDAHSGEVPCVYVELTKGARVTQAALMAFATAHIHERAALPKYIEILEELPKTAVGKVFKPDLRRLAIRRVLNAALAEAGLAVRVVSVAEDKKRGLLAQIGPKGAADPAAVQAVLGRFPGAWDWLP